MKHIDYTCFYKDIQLLFVFYDNICKVIDTNKRQIINTIDDCIYSEIYTDFLKKEDKKIYINILKGKYMESFIFETEKELEGITPNIKTNNLFSENLKNLYAKPNLDFANIIIDKDKLKKRSYLEIEEI